MSSNFKVNRDTIDLIVVLGINITYLIILGFSVGYLLENDMEVINFNGVPFGMYDVLLSLALIIPTLSTLLLIFLRRVRKEDFDLGLSKNRARRPRK
jgi:hypothetical protein